MNPCVTFSVYYILILSSKLKIREGASSVVIIFIHKVLYQTISLFMTKSMLAIQNIVGKGQILVTSIFFLPIFSILQCDKFHLFDNIYREYVYSAVVYQKYLTRLRELIIFEPWRENYHSLNRVRYF